MYVALKLVHIVSAIVAVGANLTYFYWLRVAQRGGPEATVALEGVTVLDRIANVGYVVLPITGVAMVLVGDLGFSTFWIAAAIVLFVAVGAVAGIFFAPSLKRQVQLAREGVSGPDYGATARRTLVAGAGTMLIVAAIITLMVTKPG